MTAILANGTAGPSWTGILGVILILGVIFGVSAIMMVRENRKRKMRFRRRVKEGFGRAPENEYTAEEFASISHYAQDTRAEGAFWVDDVTWNDCGMDDIFLQIANTVSSPGDDVLMKWLREPAFDDAVMRSRTDLMDYFAGHEEDRLQTQYAIAGVGRMRNMSVYDYIRRLQNAEAIGTKKYLMLGLGTLLAFILLFIVPAAGALLFIPILIINLRTYLSARDDIQLHIRSFQAVLKLLDGAKEICALNMDVLKPYQERLKKASGAFDSFRRGSFLVTSTGNVDNSLGGAIIEYIKMFFHVDLIKFDQMLSAVKGREAELVELVAAIGEIDAAIASASFREYLPVWCQRTDAEDVSLDVKDLYHVLITNPVANSIKTDGGNLVTGSNASGKSTFLKSVAIAAILAEGIDTVPAAEYKAPHLRVFTSMALTDNISGGESYFIVEIKSLKRILDAAMEEGGIPVLGIVDEVLRGTNTIERIAASSQILKTLIRPNVIAFAATHDIELTRILEKDYTNWHFTEEIEGNDIRFPYTLLTGPAKTRNAIKLLGVAGYAPEIVEAARASARHFEEPGQW